MRMLVQTMLWCALLAIAVATASPGVRGQEKPGADGAVEQLEGTWTFNAKDPKAPRIQFNKDGKLSLLTTMVIGGQAVEGAYNVPFRAKAATKTTGTLEIVDGQQRVGKELVEVVSTVQYKLMGDTLQLNGRFGNVQDQLKKNVSGTWKRVAEPKK
jgi:hypothetical protein